MSDQLSIAAFASAVALAALCLHAPTLESAGRGVSGGAGLVPVEANLSLADLLAR